MTRPGQSTTSGLSLIELVIAMALFALVAIMGLQSINATVRLSDRLTAIDDQTAELGTALALLRNDLSAITPLLFYPPRAAPRGAIDWADGGGGLHLSLAGQHSLGQSHTDMHRVEWRVDTRSGTLYRRVWPALLPVTADQISPETQVLGGVNGLRVRTYWAQIGWVDGDAPPIGVVAASSVPATDQDRVGAAPAAYFSALPLAVEVTVQTDLYGDLRLVESLR